MTVLPHGFFSKLIVWFICLAKNLRLKVKYLRAKLSSQDLWLCLRLLFGYDVVEETYQMG